MTDDEIRDRMVTYNEAIARQEEIERLLERIAINNAMEKLMTEIEDV